MRPFASRFAGPPLDLVLVSAWTRRLGRVMIHVRATDANHRRETLVGPWLSGWGTGPISPEGWASTVVFGVHNDGGEEEGAGVPSMSQALLGQFSRSSLRRVRAGRPSRRQAFDLEETSHRGARRGRRGLGGRPAACCCG